MPKSAALKSSVTQRQTAVDAVTAFEPEKSGKQLKREANKLQTAFLVGNLGKPVSVFTINGIRLTGKLRQFDQFTLLLQVPDGLDSLGILGKGLLSAGVLFRVP